MRRACVGLTRLTSQIMLGMLKFHCNMQWKLVSWICSMTGNSSLHGFNWSDSMTRTERHLCAKCYPPTRCRYSRFHLLPLWMVSPIILPTCCDVSNEQSEVHTLAKIRSNGFNIYWPSLRPKALIQSAPVPTFLFSKKNKIAWISFLCLQLSCSNVFFIPWNWFYAKAGY